MLPLCPSNHVAARHCGLEAVAMIPQLSRSHLRSRPILTFIYLNDTVARGPRLDVEGATQTYKD